MKFRKKKKKKKKEESQYQEIDSQEKILPKRIQRNKTKKILQKMSTGTDGM